MSRSFLKSVFGNRLTKALGIIIILVVIFAPSGFFTGHRTVTLEAELSIIAPTLHLRGDETPTNATLTGNIVTSTDIPVSGAVVTAFNNKKTRRTTAYSHPDGSYSLPIALVVCYAAFLFHRIDTWFFVPILVIAISDPLAALLGRTWPVGAYSIFRQHKTLVGSAAFFVSAFVITLLFTYHAGAATAWLTALLIATSTTLVEAVTLRGLDNLTVPATALLLLYATGSCI